MNRKEILSSEAYWMEQIQNQLFHQVQLYLKQNKKTQNDLAAQLGVSKSYVSQILHGNFDHKLSKLVELSLAVGLVPQLQFKPLDEVIGNDSEFASETTTDFQQMPQSNERLSALSHLSENTGVFTDEDFAGTEFSNEYSQTA
ncbi:MAG: helix-turn-helix domain-containing protein [Bacteroidia bacterium]|jgi:transcriptional regulator with XRE-family HTH domain|nr:helix-turn-helix domain-containing protein [Bacteroidia bacterium]